MRCKSLLSIVAILGVAACSKTDKSPVDSALAIGASTVPFDSLSTIEQNAQTPALAPAVVAPRRSTTSRSSGSSGSSASSGSTASSGTTTRTTTVKNTARDAAIGAAAGAIIGATTSKDKVKGAVVGGVVGGVIGGVIGNNVDVKKKKQ